ncbi:uncharacterized protein N7483_002321 [Penicillium malachiteum]|uniref:uncharacterized protein n=1 Tax=Penicillium malachiteum TaxID=1324776 RepID=UPI0025476E20|nr:uncharacterized protein N7483_002321 [Penicillium malachiteum]KAJ5737196.1 hypothetical protein N7483_002321 [Penicillium malachiteum]
MAEYQDTTIATHHIGQFFLQAEKEKTMGPKDAMNNLQDGAKSPQTPNKNQQTGATSMETTSKKIQKAQQKAVRKADITRKGSA